MRLHGRVYKDGKLWLAEVPLLDAMTQGHTRKEALAMVADLLETLANRPGFSIQVHYGMNSAECHRRFMAGEMGDDADIMEWMGLYDDMLLYQDRLATRQAATQA